MGDKLKRPTRSIVHASGDKEIAKKEIDVWFSKDEIHEYKRCDDGWV
jgi:hypothetical protein